jgi:hypothetical protein
VQAGGRRRGRGPRLLYFFRTPPGVRVGRAPIDEDAIRLLEENNPDVQFDWTRILKLPPAADAPPTRHDDRRDRRGRRDSPSRPSRHAAPEEAAQPAAQSAEPAASAQDAERMESAPASAESRAAGHRERADDAPTAPAEPLERREVGEQPDAVEPRDGDDTEPVEPRYARLGSEGLGRLRARYAEVLARIAERPMDEAAREELKTKAERLNPDAWVTAHEVAEAIEQYEVVFEELRPLLGRQPRRTPRR